MEPEVEVALAWVGQDRLQRDADGTKEAMFFLNDCLSIFLTFISLFVVAENICFPSKNLVFHEITRFVFSPGLSPVARMVGGSIGLLTSITMKIFDFLK